MLQLTPTLTNAIVGLYALLMVGTLTILGLKQLNPSKNYTELVLRVRTWWLIVLVFCIIFVANVNIALMIFAAISFFAFKEFLSLVPKRLTNQQVFFWAYLAIPIQYYCISQSWYGLFILFIPVFMFLLLPLRMMMVGETNGFLAAVGMTHWGLMTTVFSLSHMAYLLVLPQPVGAFYSGATNLLFLVLLTQLNDIAQYCWGKSIGKKKITPQISPNKTWGGFLGGVTTTVGLSYLLAPYLTPFTQTESVLTGLLIGLSGFVGDVVISALKRDVGVKDSGDLLPGHGGLLDRLDSLTYTAPLFFHLIVYLHY